MRREEGTPRDAESRGDSGSGASEEQRSQLGRRAFVGGVAAALVSRPFASQAQGQQRTAPVGYQPSRTAAAEKLGMTLRPRPLVRPDDIEAVFDAARADGDQGIIVQWDIFTTRYKARIAANAVRVRMPCFYNQRGFVDAGGLISYAAKTSESYERAAVFVDKILKGAKPALPVEQARSFELVVNLKAAKAIGVTFPQTLLLRADEILE